MHYSGIIFTITSTKNVEKEKLSGINKIRNSTFVYSLTKRLHFDDLMTENQLILLNDGNKLKIFITLQFKILFLSNLTNLSVICVKQEMFLISLPYYFNNKKKGKLGRLLYKVIGKLITNTKNNAVMFKNNLFFLK